MADIGERDHQRHRFRRRRIEAKRLIEGLGLFGNRMHDDAADADRVGRVRDAHGAVAKEGAPEAPACCERSTASRPRTATGIGSGMLRRKRPTLPATAIAPEAKA